MIAQSLLSCVRCSAAVLKVIFQALLDAISWEQIWNSSDSTNFSKSALLILADVTSTAGARVVVARVTESAWITLTAASSDSSADNNNDDPAPLLPPTAYVTVIVLLQSVPIEINSTGFSGEHKSIGQSRLDGILLRIQNEIKKCFVTITMWCKAQDTTSNIHLSAIWWRKKDNGIIRTREGGPITYKYMIAYQTDCFRFGKANVVAARVPIMGSSDHEEVQVLLVLVPRGIAAELTFAHVNVSTIT